MRGGSLAAGWLLLSENCGRSAEENAVLREKRTAFNKHRRASHPAIRDYSRVMKSECIAALTAPTGLRVKRILAPIDFSPASKKAVDYALSVGELFNAKVTLVHVFEPLHGPDVLESCRLRGILLFPFCHADLQKLCNLRSSNIQSLVRFAHDLIDDSLHVLCALPNS
jgi:Universal stress protein family